MELVEEPITRRKTVPLNSKPVLKSATKCSTLAERWMVRVLWNGSLSGTDDRLVELVVRVMVKTCGIRFNQALHFGLKILEPFNKKRMSIQCPSVFACYGILSQT